MATIGLRDHYLFRLSESTHEVADRLSTRTRKNNPAQLKFRRAGGVLLLRFPSHKLTATTPQMEIHLSAHPEGGTKVHAIIGPSFGVWKFMKAALLSCVLLCAVGLILAFFEWSGGEGTWGFCMVLLSIAACLFLLLLAEVGKAKGREQIEVLKAFVTTAWGTTIFGER